MPCPNSSQNPAVCPTATTPLLLRIHLSDQDLASCYLFCAPETKTSFLWPVLPCSESSASLAVSHPSRTPSRWGTANHCLHSFQLSLSQNEHVCMQTKPIHDLSCAQNPFHRPYMLAPSMQTSLVPRTLSLTPPTKVLLQHSKQAVLFRKTRVKISQSNPNQVPSFLTFSSPRAKHVASISSLLLDLIVSHLHLLFDACKSHNVHQKTSKNCLSNPDWVPFPPTDTRASSYLRLLAAVCMLVRIYDKRKAA
jgi:hypothetical protein